MGCVYILLILLAVGISLDYGKFCLMYGGWRYCALIAAATLIAVVLIGIVKLIQNIVKKHPVFTGKKAAKLEGARQQDEANALNNQNNKAKIDAKWQLDRESRVKEIDEMLVELKEDFEEAKDELDIKRREIDNNDCLGEDEKNIQVIEMLIYFIESRRADSIKEALHEYDKALVNKQMVELEEKRLAIQKTQMEKEASDRKKLLALQKEANDRARWAAMDNARQRDQMIDKLSSLESFALSDYYKNL